MAAGPAGADRGDGPARTRGGTDGSRGRQLLALGGWYDRLRCSAVKEPTSSEIKEKELL